MTALDDWLAAAKAARHGDLIYFNYLYENAATPALFDTAVGADFAAHLMAKAGCGGDHKNLLDEFVGGNLAAKLSGPTIAYAPTLISVFSLLKLAKVFGLTANLASYSTLVAAGSPAALDRQASAEILSLIERLHSGRASASGSATTTTRAGRSVRSTRRGGGYDKHFAADEILWVAPYRAARALIGVRRPPAQRALALRRVLGLPTCHPPWPGASRFEQILGNSYFRVSFRLRPSARPYQLHKPTVFSGGFADVYGSYRPRPPSDGWGRTVTLCAGDADDGSVGFPEAVVPMSDLMASAVMRLGRVDPVHQPLPRSSLVDPQVFAARRHRDELGMDIR